MVACALLLDGVHRPHLDALVEAAGGEDVVELVIACRLWVLTWEVVGDDIGESEGSCVAFVSACLPSGTCGPMSSNPMAAILSNTERYRASQYLGSPPSP